MSDPAANLQRGISSEEDKDKGLQAKPLADAITPVLQRDLGNRGKIGNEEEDKKKVSVQAKSTDESIEIQRQPEIEDEKQEPVQAQFIQKATSSENGFDASADVEARIDMSKGGGNALPDTVRSYMEPRFGMDFSHVRVHTGNEAIQLNRDVGAKAFTHGSDIYYGADHGPTNLELTAHELTHVVQQTGSSPLQAKRVDEIALSSTETAIRRACAACGAKKEDEERNESSSGALRSIQKKSAIDSRSLAHSNYLLQRIPVSERTPGPVVQGAWNLTEKVTNSSPVIGEATRGNGSTLTLPLPTGSMARPKRGRKQGFGKYTEAMPTW